MKLRETVILVIMAATAIVIIIWAGNRIGWDEIPRVGVFIFFGILALLAAAAASSSRPKLRK